MTFSVLRYLFSVFFVTALAVGAGFAPAKAEDAASAKETAPVSQTATSLPVMVLPLCEKLNAASVALWEPADLAAVKAFYAARECRPFWIEGHGLTRSARLILAEFDKAADWGLDAADFRIDAVAREMSWNNDEALAAELAITSAVLRYARYARGGRIADPSTQLSSYIDRRPSLPDASEVLTRMVTDAEPDKALTSYHPQQDQFLKLKALLKTYRDMSADDQSTQIAVKGPTLTVGKRHGDVALLKRRFGIASQAGDEDLFTEDLAAAVKVFQKSKSLRGDAIVGSGTRRALNRGGSPSDKIAAVVANMEAWRWMPEDLGHSYLFVNIPSYALTHVEDGRVIFNERVIVGKQSTQTPIFSHELSSIVLRPEWYMPDSIKIKKLVSASNRGRTLESQGYAVKRNGKRISSSSVNWSRVNLSAYTIYQPSGGRNALGNVKFLFPNKHSVYMHDTPERSLFNGSSRTYSAGCVRVRNPLALAAQLLDEDKGAGKFDVNSLVRKGAHNNEIKLDKPVPVHIGYFTVWVEENGTATFLEDSYGHQKRITLALGGRWKQIDRGRDHLAAVDTSQLKSVSLRSRAASESRRRMAETEPRGGRRPVGFFSSLFGPPL